ncbi:MAG: hypothetical protein AAFZ35_16940 [Cyanobacteria bacterium J06649_12]
MLKFSYLFVILLSLSACGAGNKSLTGQYLESISAGDITTAKSLFCGLTDDLRIMELTSADSWEIISESPQVFGEVELTSIEVQVTSKLRGDGQYIISVANAEDIEAFIQHSNKTLGYTDIYEPSQYKQSGECIAATQKA